MMDRKSIAVLVESFSPNAQKGKQVVSRYCASTQVSPHKKKQAAQVLLLARKISQMVVLDQKAGNSWRREKLQGLQRKCIFILEEIGSNAKLSKTGLKLDIKAGLFLEINRALKSADMMLASYKRLELKPAKPMKKKTAARRKPR